MNELTFWRTCCERGITICRAPKPMKEEVKHFFDENEKWLSAVLEQGRKSRDVQFKGSAIDVARAMVGSLEGAMMLARSYGDASRFDSAAERLIAEL